MTPLHIRAAIITRETRSMYGTVHTSTKGRWRNDAIASHSAVGWCHLQYDKSEKQSLYRDGDCDRNQNLIIYSMARCQPSLKISCKSVSEFLRKVANEQTANRRTDKKRRKHSLLGLAKVINITHEHSCATNGRQSLKVGNRAWIQTAAELIM